MSVAAGSDKPIDPHTTAGKIEGLRQRRHEAVTRRQKSVDKQHSRGKLTAMERIEMLRKAFDATMNDPEFRAEVAKAKVEFHPLPGAELQKIIADTSAVKPEVVNRMQQILGR